MLPLREVWFTCLAFTILKSTWIRINWDDLLLSFFACCFFFFFFIFGSLLRQAHALKNRSFGDGWSDVSAWAMRINPQSLTLLFNYMNLKNDVCVTHITALLFQRRHLNGWLKGLQMHFLFWQKIPFEHRGLLFHLRWEKMGLPALSFCQLHFCNLNVA